MGIKKTKVGAIGRAGQAEGACAKFCLPSPFHPSGSSDFYLSSQAVGSGKRDTKDSVIQLSEKLREERGHGSLLTILCALDHSVRTWRRKGRRNLQQESWPEIDFREFCIKVFTFGR